MSVSIEPYACATCTLRGSFGLAPMDTPGVANRRDAHNGVVHDPIWHEPSCPITVKESAYCQPGSWCPWRDGEAEVIAPPIGVPNG